MCQLLRAVFVMQHFTVRYALTGKTQKSVINLRQKLELCVFTICSTIRLYCTYAQCSAGFTHASNWRHPVIRYIYSILDRSLRHSRTDCLQFPSGSLARESLQTVAIDLPITARYRTSSLETAQVNIIDGTVPVLHLATSQVNIIAG